eukprot:9705794-Alexandrium_andersonii.AAC.1
MHYALQPHPCCRERTQCNNTDPANAIQSEPVAAPIRTPSFLSASELSTQCPPASLLFSLLTWPPPGDFVPEWL